MSTGVNGCGCGSGLLKFFKPPYHEFFRDCCNAHDAAYDCGGDEKFKKTADRWLYRNMVELSLKSFSPVKATWMSCIALTYYVSVRLFGRKYFNYRRY